MKNLLGRFNEEYSKLIYNEVKASSFANSVLNDIFFNNLYKIFLDAEIIKKSGIGELAKQHFKQDLVLIRILQDEIPNSINDRDAVQNYYIKLKNKNLHLVEDRLNIEKLFTVYKPKYMKF